MPLNRFQDLMSNEELYFRRSDLFPQDEEEGIPPENYLRRVMGLRPFVLEDEKELNHQIGSLAQFREMYYVNCWHLFRKETPEIWKEFARYGVALCSRDLLRSTLDGMIDKTFLGVMRYGEERLTQTMRVNTLQFINTKRERFRDECEVRAILDCPSTFSAMNRHFDPNNWPHRRPLPENALYHWVHDFKRRRIDLKSLIVSIVVSPGASQEMFDEIKLWVQTKQYSCEVRWSDLRGQMRTPPERNSSRE
ncbi:MAG: hypothetical protein ACYDA9_16910 [Terriglobia bacterium]